MSLVVTVHVGEGIVIAADSRTTYHLKWKKNQENTPGPDTVEHLGAHYTDTANKIFLTANNVGIAVCGDLALDNMPLTGEIEKFVRDFGYLPVEDIPRELLDYFRNMHQHLNTFFFVAGYREGDNRPSIYQVHVKENRINTVDTEHQGAAYSGETDVISRITGNLYVKAQQNGAEQYLRHTNFPILWQYFTLQDAIDFAQYAIKTTIDTMKFQSRLKSVGGDIDILVIKPEGASWIAKKELHR